MKRHYAVFFLISIVSVILDQISKHLVMTRIDMYESIRVIDGFFNLVHVRNRGMAFGLLNRPQPGLSFYILVIAAVLAIGVIIFWFTRLKKEEKGLTTGLSLILGGAAGNLIDRFRLSEVIDFLDFYVGSYHWPAFNIADSCITVGTIWIVVYMFFFSPKAETL